MNKLLRLEREEIEHTDRQQYHRDRWEYRNADPVRYESSDEEVAAYLEMAARWRREKVARALAAEEYLSTHPLPFG